MSDASSIRRINSPVAPSLTTGSTTTYNVGPAAGTLPVESLPSSGFYQGAIRFLINSTNYTYTYTDSNGISRSRATGQVYVNTGAQFCPLVNVVLSVPLIGGATEVTQPIFIADKPYNIISVQEYHSVVGYTSSTLALKIVGATPEVTIVDPTGAGSGAVVYATVSGGIIQAFSASPNIVQAGANYGTGTYAVIPSYYTAGTQAVLGAVTIGGGAVTGIALTSGGTGYANPTAPGSGTVVLANAIKLDSTVNYNQYAPLSATLANTQLSIGQVLCYVISGTATGYVGTVTVTLQPQ